MGRPYVGPSESVLRRRAQHRADYVRHRAERLALGREWAQRNHEKVLRMAGERYRRIDPRRRFAMRANRKVAQYGRPDDILDWTTLPEGPWSCHNCGVACESWDHIDPLAVGGANKVVNLLPSCMPCNQRRTAGLGPSLHVPKTHCLRGHEYSVDNTRTGSRGERRCRACARVYAQESRDRRIAA